MDHETSMTRIQNWLTELNKIGKTAEGVSRLAYTKEEKDVHQVFQICAEKLNMKVSRDAAGNVIARREGRLENAPAIAIGSHLDTVYAGGEFDGTAGVVAGLEIVARLQENEIITDAPIEVIAFAAEESARFGISTLGSKAMSGQLNKERITDVKDRDGITLTEALSTAGFSIEDIEDAERDKSKLRAFFEVHIEQGPELESQKKSIGVVNGIAAPTRLRIIVQGKANHSGTTSMDQRKDALAAASEIIIAVEELGMAEKSHGTVATIGVCDVKPGAMNVIPGEVELLADIRSINQESKTRICSQVNERAQTIARKREIEITLETLADEMPVLLDDNLQAYLDKSCRELGIEPLIMPSGAGHDAMNMAKKWPVGMLFIPCRGGLSHHPDEWASTYDLKKATDVLENAVKQFTTVSEIEELVK